MRAVIALFAAGALAIFGGTAHGTALPSSYDADWSSAVAVVERFHDALQRGELAAAQALLHPDVQIYEEGRVERSREEYASHHLASDARFLADAQVDVVSRTGRASGALAHVMTESHTRKGERRFATLETVVLARQDDRWQIVHVHWSTRNLDE